MTPSRARRTASPPRARRGWRAPAEASWKAIPARTCASRQGGRPFRARTQEWRARARPRSAGSCRSVQRLGQWPPWRLPAQAPCRRSGRLRDDPDESQDASGRCRSSPRPWALPGAALRGGENAHAPRPPARASARLRIARGQRGTFRDSRLSRRRRSSRHVRRGAWRSPDRPTCRRRDPSPACSWPRRESSANGTCVPWERPIHLPIMGRSSEFAK